MAAQLTNHMLQHTASKASLSHSQHYIPPPSVLFLIYINYTDDGINSYATLFANEAKNMRRVGSKENCKMLQDDLDRIYE